MEEAQAVSFLPAKKKEINYQFKLLYAIGIINVLIAHSHSEQIALWNELIHVAGYTIAMFVFGSGYFYSSKNDTAPFKYIYKKFTRLIIPLYAWNLFYAVLVLCLSRFGITIGTPVTFHKLFLNPLYSPILLGYNDPAWFLVPLFVTEGYNVLLRRLTVKIAGFKTDLIMLIFNLILGFLGVAISIKSPSCGWQLFFTRFMYFAPFYSIGYFYKTYLEKKDTFSSFWYFMIIIVIELLLILINGHTSSYSIVAMDPKFFENPFLPFFSGLLGIAFWLRIARIFTPVIGRSKLINTIADNTFPIMMNHILGFMILKLFYLLLSSLFDFLPEFDIEQFKVDVFYFYVPRGRGFPLLYVVAGIIVPIGIQRILNFVKKNIYCRKSGS